MVHNALPDHIQPGLEMLLVGINPGLRSARVGHHFAGVNNRFWDLLHDAGLTPRRLTYEEDARLLEFGLGLTNIATRPTRSSAELKPEDFDRGRRELLGKIARFKPWLVAFVGLTAFREFRRGYGKSSAKLQCGLQNDTIADAQVFVVPNPSGRNAHYPYQEMLKYWTELAGCRKGLSTKNERRRRNLARRSRRAKGKAKADARAPGSRDCT